MDRLRHVARPVPTSDIETLMMRRSASFLAWTLAAGIAVGCDSSPPQPAPAPQEPVEPKTPETKGEQGKARKKQEPGPDSKPSVPKRRPDL
jgi:hypothetical protein